MTSKTFARMFRFKHFADVLHKIRARELT